MTQKITTSNIESTSLASFIGPLITNISIANSSYSILDDTAVSNTGGYAVITGNNFTSGAQVLFGSAPATSVTYVNSSTLRVQVPALTAGSYVVYVQNVDGSTALKLNGITSSPIPIWSTSSTLPNGDADNLITINLSATSDSNVVYQVSNNSTLPTGTSLLSNGYFYGTITGITSDTLYNFSVDAIDAENQEISRSFSITINAGDSYYYSTILHLSGKTPSTNWLTDSSSNKFPINANTTSEVRPTQFSPFNTDWSYYFDGTGDYLNFADSDAFELPGDFTLEGWFYSTAFNTYNDILTKGAAGVYQPYYIFTNASGNLLFYSSSTGSSWDIASGVSFGTVVLNRWYHFAVSRSGTNLRMFLNGSLVNTISNGSALFNNTQSLTVGARSDGTETFSGYISNIRVVKGTALYTNTFTPSTTPLTAVANTSLLTCQSGRLIDNSSNSFTPVRYGDVKTTNFGPFAETNIIDGSGYFDGTGDFLSVANASTFNCGTGDFTLECWYYDDGTSSTYPSIFSSTDWATGTGGVSLRYNNTGAANKFTFHWYGVGDAFLTSSSTYPPRVWHHVALTRSGNNFSLWVNGLLAATGTNSGTVDWGLVSGGPKIGGGNWDGANSYIKGFISNLRFIKGTALYTSTFTPPTSRLTNVTNTILLTLQYRNSENSNRTFDSSGLNNPISRFGGSIGTFSPFSPTGWSAYFDGSGDFVNPPDAAAALIPGASTVATYTVEGWFLLTGPNKNYNALWDWRTTGFAQGYYLRLNSSGYMELVDSASVWTGTTVFTPNVWHHVAFTVVSNGTSTHTYYVFLDGVLQKTGTNNVASTSGRLTIGSNTDRSTHTWQGYISNFRVLNGTALYTSNFTVPTSELIPVANTVLITCNSNRFRDTSNNNFIITRGGNTLIEPLSPFKTSGSWSANVSGASIYLDGTGDYLIANDSPELDIGTGDYTLEAWIYRTSTGVQRAIVDTRGSSGVGLLFYTPTTNKLAIFDSTSAYITSANNVPAFEWAHVAAARSSGNTKLFINGVQEASITGDTRNNVTGAGGIYVGRQFGSTTNDFSGYISSVNLIKGTALYTSNFTPATIPAITSNNSILTLNFSNPGVMDSTARNNLDNNGDVRITNSIVKFNTGSYYFDGTGDYINAANTVPLGGDFTIECWYYQTGGTGFRLLVSTRVLPDETGASAASAVFLGFNGNSLYYDSYNTQLTGSGSITNSTWNHIACVRSGSTVTLYLNGVSQGSVSDSTQKTLRNIMVGGQGSLYFITGYIDDLRITRGFARYTSNFTPPTNPLPIK